MYVVMAGLPASGKSTIAAILQQRISAALLDKDVVRACLFGQHTDYSREQDDLCMEAIYSTAGYLFRKHPNLAVILDGRTYSRAYQVQAVCAAADKACTSIKFIECVCSDASAKSRLEFAVDQQLHLAQDRDYALYMRSKAGAEPLPEPKLTISTDDLSVEQCVQVAVEYLDAIS